VETAELERMRSWKPGIIIRQGGPSDRLMLAQTVVHQEAAWGGRRAPWRRAWNRSLALLRQRGSGTLESKALMSNLQSSAPEILAQVTILKPTRVMRTQSKSNTCTGNIGWE
jgi:hypothetical protein